MDRSSPAPERDTRRDMRAALVASGVLAPGLLLVHGLAEGEVEVVAVAVAAALIVVLVLARAGQLMVDVRALWAAEGRISASETALKEAQQLAQLGRAIVQSSSDAIYSVAADGTVTSWNAAAERLFGRPAAEMLGHPIASVWPPEHLELNRSMFERAFAGEVVTDVETVRPHRDGSRVAVTVSWSPIKDEAGAITGVSVIARDITQRRQLEEQLVRQALHDPLTGLANRALFTDRLEHALARGRRPGVTVAILVIDLDGFKDINDSLAMTPVTTC